MVSRLKLKVMKNLTVKESIVLSILGHCLCADGISDLRTVAETVTYQGNKFDFEDFIKTAQKLASKGLITLDNEIFDLVDHRIKK